MFEKKVIGKIHALALPRQSVTLGKMLHKAKCYTRQNVTTGKLKLGKKLPRQNVTLAKLN